MKNILNVSLICLSIFIGSAESSSAADIKGYAGLNYVLAEYDHDYGVDADLGAVGIKVGVDINDYLGAEMRAGLGVDDDSVNYLTSEINVELNYYYGVYMRPKYKIDQIQIYGVLGFTKAEFEASAFGSSEKDDDTYFSYGIGLEWFFYDNISASVEYMKHLDADESDWDFKSFNIGLTYYFQ